MNLVGSFIEPDSKRFCESSDVHFPWSINYEGLDIYFRVRADWVKTTDCHLSQFWQLIVHLSISFLGPPSIEAGQG